MSASVEVRSFFLLSALLSLCVGCGGSSHELQTARISGKVTLDGEPLGEGTVMFLPKAGRPARGNIRQDGSFSLSTYGNDDGAVIGTHKVTVTAKHEDTDKYFESNPPPGANLVEWVAPERYSNPGTSGLTFEVTSSGDRNVLLELTRKP